MKRFTEIYNEYKNKEEENLNVEKKREIVKEIVHQEMENIEKMVEDYFSVPPQERCKVPVDIRKRYLEELFKRMWRLYFGFSIYLEYYKTTITVLDKKIREEFEGLTYNNNNRNNIDEYKNKVKKFIVNIINNEEEFQEYLFSSEKNILDI